MQTFIVCAYLQLRSLTIKGKIKRVDTSDWSQSSSITEAMEILSTKYQMFYFMDSVLESLKNNKQITLK